MANLEGREGGRQPGSLIILSYHKRGKERAIFLNGCHVLHPQAHNDLTNCIRSLFERNERSFLSHHIQLTDYAVHFHRFFMGSLWHLSTLFLSFI